MYNLSEMYTYVIKSLCFGHLILTQDFIETLCAKIVGAKKNKCQSAGMMITYRNGFRLH